MYASNEDEFNREDDDWVLLRQTPPTTTVNYLSISFIESIFIYVQDSS
jgi:hypothetical protein